MRYLAAISGDRHGFAVDQDFAGVRRFEADEMLEQNTFAAAARSHDDKNFPGLDFEVNALEHFLAAKTFAQAAHLQADAGRIIVGSRLFISKESGSGCNQKSR